MPVIENQYNPINPIFRSAQFSTIYASLIRYVPAVKFKRERLELADGDFMDLDWSRKDSKKLIITLPGLEGKSRSLYSRAAINYFNKRGWDGLGINYRGCSGEDNRLLRGYHMGVSDDLRIAVNYAIDQYGYTEIVIVGYSLGGNIALKYAGEAAASIRNEVKSIITFSVPLDIKKSNERMNQWYNWHYVKWFMFTLNLKANGKKKLFPKALEKYKGFFMSGDFIYFDTHYTAPANGFSDVETYWKESSSASLLHNIRVPSLIVSAEDDTFLSENCYPIEVAKKNDYLFLEMPKHGGHCGYIRKLFEKEWWMEQRAFDFVQAVNNTSLIEL